MINTLEISENIENIRESMSASNLMLNIASDLTPELNNEIIEITSNFVDFHEVAEMLSITYQTAIHYKNGKGNKEITRSAIARACLKCYVNKSLELLENSQKINNLFCTIVNKK